jgi:hypothetical protein
MKRKATEPMSNEESGKALDEWAERIAALEPDVAAGVASYAKRLAGDTRLAKADRQFAAAQADAIRRAIRRAKAGKII